MMAREDGCGPSFEQTWISLTQEFGWNWLTGSEEDENAKSFLMTGDQKKLTWAFSA